MPENTDSEQKSTDSDCSTITAEVEILRFTGENTSPQFSWHVARDDAYALSDFPPDLVRDALSKALAHDDPESMIHGMVAEVEITPDGVTVEANPRCECGAAVTGQNHDSPTVCQACQNLHSTVESDS